MNNIVNSNIWDPYIRNETLLYKSIFELKSFILKPNYLQDKKDYKSNIQDYKVYTQ
jgi:hypothetical protein